MGLVDALVYLETRNPPVYHGDISPRDIILDKDHPCLVDFGLAYIGDVCDKGCVTGTAPYRPPERDMPGRPWPKSGDVYSLGVVLCELIFGELPYVFEGGKLDKQHLREDLFEPRGQASREFLGVLRQAIAPNQTERFNNALEFQQALICIPELGKTVEPPRQTRCINYYLSEVLKVYNRGGCNAENRGMDSTFARSTYVPTELDKYLLPDILAHKYALVVLTGNPGDGKTAFLQKLSLHLSRKGETLPLNHWVIEKDSWTFECVLDGSAADSSRGLNSDEILIAFLLHSKMWGGSEAC
jgi:serine/threonine protein kinase